MNEGKEVLVYAFDSSCNPLSTVDSDQARYLKSYLVGLSAAQIIEEQNYFDRDYLSEFSAFYSLSTRGYPNICRRLHFFSSSEVNKEVLTKALGLCTKSKELLQSSYLGFAIIRPIKAAPLGRTVLRWFEDKDLNNRRITTPSRNYKSNVAGLELNVVGLAWQQQDTGVAACATVGLWTMFHSSAFDDHHSIPTTADITKSAHNTASLGSRIFPSKGLKVEQILEAIKEQKLAPLFSSGDRFENGIQFFSKKRLASTSAAFIRSGYPVLFIGSYLHVQYPCRHMVCAVGFRDSTQYDVLPGEYGILDEGVDILYIHDDNIGPNVRCEIVELPDSGIVALSTKPPGYISTDVAEPKSEILFCPEHLIVGVHEELRISADDFFIEGDQKTSIINKVLVEAYRASGFEPTSLLFSTRFWNVRDYMRDELPRHFGSDSILLGKIRLELVEKVPPMSLHIGVVRIALSNDQASLLMDIIYDTTDSDRNRPIFCHIIFDSNLQKLLSTYNPELVESIFGPQVKGFLP